MVTKGSYITVSYSFVDGFHCFASDDPAAKGLCVACAHPKDAFDEVTNQLNVLLKHNLKNDSVSCQPAGSFEGFQEWLESEVAEWEKGIKPLKTTLGWQTTPGKKVA